MKGHKYVTSRAAPWIFSPARRGVGPSPDGNASLMFIFESKSPKNSADVEPVDDNVFTADPAQIEISSAPWTVFK